MIAVVAEKPSVGMDIARVLGCRERGDGFVQGAGYIVTWAVGHLVSQCEPDEIDEKYRRWNMKDLPILPESIPCKVLPIPSSEYPTPAKRPLNSRLDGSRLAEAGFEPMPAVENALDRYLREIADEINY